MTKNETVQIMAILKATYPAYYARQSKPEIDAVIHIWHEMFSGDDVRLVGAAVKAYISTDSKGFPPSIGQIREKMNLLVQSAEMTEQEAWNCVMKAISNSWYHAQKEFEMLPDGLKRIVGSPNQLREWGVMSTEQVQTVVASNFMRSYREVMKHTKEIAALPGSVKSNMLNGRFVLSEEKKQDEK